MLNLPLITLLAFSFLSPASAEENLLKPLGEAFSAWTDGRPEDAVGSLEYVAFRSSDTVLTLSAIKEISVLLAELGRNQEALAYLAKGEILAPEDPYLAFEKGWNFLSVENYLEARSAFEKTITITGEADIVQQARFGLALAEARLGGPLEAASGLQTVYQKYPYLLSPAAEVISAQYEALKKRQHAVTFLEEALAYDPRNIQAEIDIARLYDKAGYYLQAWQTYYNLSELDPGDEYAADKTSKLAKYVKGKLDNLLYWTRMAWPVHLKPVNRGEGNLFRVGLFSDAEGEPAPLTGFSFIANTGFAITDSRLGAVGEGKANMQWGVKYNPLNRIYELRDNMGSVIHSTRNSFRLTPRIKGGVILIKSPELVPQRGINRGDREVTGELNIIARPDGFIAVNTVSLEAIAPAIVASLSAGGKQPEELKALAVVVRSKLVSLKNARNHSGRDYDICDSPHCLAFPGLQAENETALKAVESTRDEVLFKDGSPVAGDFHTACGGFTESEVNDNGRAMGRMTPFSLYYLTLKAPPDNLLCLADDRTAASDVSWTLMLEPGWIEARVNRLAKVGRIRSMYVLKRRPGGRALTLRIEGASGSLVLEGFEAISRALAAGMLRSALFTMRPVFEGKYPKYFLLRGIGTGDGRGYCVLGGHGLAKNYGSNYLEILKHYFPGYKVKKLGK